MKTEPGAVLSHLRGAAHHAVCFRLRDYRRMTASNSHSRLWDRCCLPSFVDEGDDFYLEGHVAHRGGRKCHPVLLWEEELAWDCLCIAPNDTRHLQAGDRGSQRHLLYNGDNDGTHFVMQPGQDRGSSVLCLVAGT